MAVYWWFTMVQCKTSLNKSKKMCPILSHEKTTKTHPTHPQTTCNCAGHSSLLGSTAIKRWKQPAAWNRCDVCFVAENFHPKNGGKDRGGRMWWNMWNLKSSKNMYLPVSFLWKVEDFFVTNFVLEFFLVKGEWHPRVKHENSWNKCYMKFTPYRYGNFPH